MTISDLDYYEILSSIGYPVVTEENLEFQKADIEKYFIYPALREFFIWFPIKEVQSQMVTSSFDIDFPDEYTFGIIDARINTSVTSGGATTSPFMNEINFSMNKSSKMYGTNNDYGVQESKYYERAYKQAEAAYIRAQRISVDDVNRTVSGYTNISGELIITWAKYSENFSNVPFKKKNEVMDLAKSRVMRGFSMLRNQLDSDTGVSFNTQDLMSRAEDLERKVLEKWQSISKIVVIRN
jgi:hypothetical protein